METSERILILKGEYRALSECQEYFTRGSVHRANKFIEKRIIEVLTEIEVLKPKV